MNPLQSIEAKYTQSVKKKQQQIKLNVVYCGV